MKLIFAGTRGFIDAHSRRHRMHAALDVAYKKNRIRIDCGADRRSRIDDIRAEAILVTHAHPDQIHNGPHGPRVRTRLKMKIILLLF